MMERHETDDPIVMEQADFHEPCSGTLPLRQVSDEVLITADEQVDAAYEYSTLSGATAGYEDINPDYVSPVVRYHQAFDLLRDHTLLEQTVVPEAVHDAAVMVEQGVVEYERVTDLLQHMRRYFAPANGDIADVRIMERLESEIEAWAAGGKSSRYRDPEDQRMDDPGADPEAEPYENTGSRFTGYGISVIKDQNGFALSLNGRGLAYNPFNPTEQIERYADFMGKDVAYRGAVTVTYTAPPPAADIIPPLPDPAPDGEPGIEGPVEVSLPVAAALAHIQGLVGLTDDARERLLRAITESRFTNESPAVSENGLTIRVSPHNWLYSHGRPDADNPFTEYSQVYNDPLRRSFSLPELQLHIIHTNQEQQAALAEILHAAGVVIDGLPHKSYAHGYVGGYAEFVINQMDEDI